MDEITTNTERTDRLAHSTELHKLLKDLIEYHNHAKE